MSASANTEFKAALRAHLAADEALGQLTGGRVYPVIAPQNQNPPFVLYRQVGGVPLQDLNGLVEGAPRMAIDAVAQDYGTAQAMLDRVINRLGEWERRAELGEQSEEWLPGDEGDEQGLIRIRQLVQF